MRKAVIDLSTNIVENTIEADDGFSIDGKLLVNSETAGIGNVYHPDLGTFSVVDPPPTIEEYKSAIVVLLNSTARQKSYDDAVSCASYAVSTNEQWRQEAQTFVAWRDAVWAFAYSELARVQSGEIAPPTLNEFMNNLPIIEW